MSKYHYSIIVKKFNYFLIKKKIKIALNQNLYFKLII